MIEEMFDVVDELDQVVFQAPRSVVHAQKLLHRAVHVFVFNPAGELLLQLRSAAKDEYPLCYTSSASGHLAAGELYAAAAARELAEELGLQCTLEWLAKFPAAPETAFEHTMLYRAVSAETPRPDPVEIAEANFYRLDQVAALIVSEPARISPPLRVLFDWYTECGPGAARAISGLD